MMTGWRGPSRDLLSPDNHNKNNSNNDHNYSCKTTTAAEKKLALFLAISASFPLFHFLKITTH